VTYAEIVAARRALHIYGYATLADVGCDGEWITPYQILSRASTGPVLVAFNWLDAETARKNAASLLRDGYMHGMQFNRVMDRALALCRLHRRDIYLTQAFQLLPERRSAPIPARDVYLSFDQITRHELVGRRVIALGSDAQTACKKFGIKLNATCHPSARGRSYEAKATQLASAIVEAR
jgi:hypothetical protein